MALGNRNYVQLQEQDKRDIIGMAYANSRVLHYSTGTIQCENPTQCMLCTESARLAIQWYRPLLEERFVRNIQAFYGITCPIPHLSLD
jgi:hypothetical protein